MFEEKARQKGRTSGCVFHPRSRKSKGQENREKNYACDQARGSRSTRPRLLLLLAATWSQLAARVACLLCSPSQEKSVEATPD